MNFNEYQDACCRTAGKHFTPGEALANWAMGLCGESGEYTELIKKHLFHGKELDKEKAYKELGDVFYYLAMCATQLGISLEEIAIINIDKLKARYPEKFTLGGGIREEDLTK